MLSGHLVSVLIRRIPLGSLEWDYLHYIIIIIVVII